MSDKLPNSLSGLIRVALRDLAKVEAQPRKYKVDMSTWHSWSQGKCSVCFAGAVMACTMGVAPTDYVRPTWFDEGDKLSALNLLRCGSVSDAAETMNKSDRYVKRARRFDREIVRYARNPKGFRRQMNALARDLERAHL